MRQNATQSPALSPSQRAARISMLQSKISVLEQELNLPQLSQVGPTECVSSRHSPSCPRGLGHSSMTVDELSMSMPIAPELPKSRRPVAVHPSSVRALQGSRAPEAPAPQREVPPQAREPQAQAQEQRQEREVNASRRKQRPKPRILDQESLDPEELEGLCPVSLQKSRQDLKKKEEEKGFEGPKCMEETKDALDGDTTQNTSQLVQKMAETQPENAELMYRLLEAQKFNHNAQMAELERNKNAELAMARQLWDEEKDALLRKVDAMQAGVLTTSAHENQPASDVIAGSVAQLQAEFDGRLEEARRDFEAQAALQAKRAERQAEDFAQERAQLELRAAAASHEAEELRGQVSALQREANAFREKAGPDAVENKFREAARQHKEEVQKLRDELQAREAELKRAAAGQSLASEQLVQRDIEIRSLQASLDSMKAELEKAREAAKEAITGREEAVQLRDSVQLLNSELDRLKGENESIKKKQREQLLSMRDQLDAIEAAGDAEMGRLREKLKRAKADARKQRQ